MSESIVTPLRASYDQLMQSVDAAPQGAEREQLKKDIIQLFKTVDGAITDLGALREEIRVLVDRYKQLAQGEQGGQAPQFTGAAPAVHADHIGASTFIEKGWSLISLGDYPGAVQALRKALKLSPGELPAQSLLGWALMLNEEYDAALETFHDVLTKAIEHLSKAIRLDNDKKATLYAHYYLGLVYLARDMYEDAETFLQKTLKLGPNLIEAYYELGRAQWFAGDPDTAKATWDDGHRANKFNPWGKKCKEMLELVAQGQEPPR
jgi:tetratricopeptide (TPR) repeat protein